MKHINADRLRAEIERLKENHERNLDKPMERGRIGHAHGYVDCCDELLAFIDSLQQRRPESRIMTREMIEGRLLQNDTESWNEDYDEEDLLTRFAFYTYKDEPGVLYLSNLFVEEASRNRGLGTKILKAAEKVAETIGASSIRLKVKQDSPANAWYRKRGYGYVASDDGYDWLEKTLKSI